MAYDEWYTLGQRVRRLLDGGEGGGGLQVGARVGGGALAGPYGAGWPEIAPNSAGVVGMFNQAARLRPGHLLVVYLARNAVYQVDPDSGTITYLFTLGHEQNPFLWRVLADREGRIYCTLSGVRSPTSPTRDAVFGMAGVVVRVNLHLGEVEALAVGDELVDPCGMSLLDDARLLVSDFAGFGDTGAVYTVDRVTGELRTVARGGLLVEPVSTIMDPDGVLWVANSHMHYHYPHRGGVLEKDDGEVLRIDPDGRQTVVVPRQSPAAGSVVGIHPADDPDYVIAVKGDWPVMESGAVLRVHKASGKVETLLSASREEPRFYSTHVGLSGSILWVGETYRKELLAYDLCEGRVVHTIDMSRLMGPYEGVSSSFEGLESVSVVPLDLREQP
ncbi:MAG: hypothetical protein JO040_03900 [Gemmatimonadetes bacterium]|nr:hypothetical protein [Gemmatimonadota bacterium]